MVVLNINEKQWYIYEKGFAEDVINDMFKEYFDELYQKDAVERRLIEIWKRISMKIPERAILVEKDSVLYSVTSDLEFEVTPEDFFEIDEVSHPILIECFNCCYTKFKNLLKNYKNWNDKSDTKLRETDIIPNVYLGTQNHYTPYIESLSNTLEIKKTSFEKILSISLKNKMCEQVCPKILKVYESAILQSNPIMLITKTDFIFGCKVGIQKIYAVTDDLKVQEVTYSLIERELDEIIHEVVPEDTDFLANIIYNFIMLPLKKAEPFIRINKVQNNGLNATIFLREKEIPVVCSLSMSDFYTFLKNGEKSDFPTDSRIRYDYERIIEDPISPKQGMNEFTKINKEMFNGMVCYVEDKGKSAYIYGSEERYNFLYQIKNGKIEEIYNSYEMITKNSDEYKKIKEETEKVKKQGSYSFWKLTIPKKKSKKI